MKQSTLLFRTLRALIVGVAATIGFKSTVPAGVPVVRTVPWVPNHPLIPHDTFSNRVVTLKGACDQQGADLRWTWDFGDQSPTASGTIANKDIIEKRHSYTGPIGTLYTARLAVTNTTTGEAASKAYYVIIRDVSDPTNRLKIEVNIAIDEGLWWLYKTGTRSGTFYYWNNIRYGDHYANTTASAVQAFEVNGHRGGHPDNPYSDAVQGGLDFLFTRLYAENLSMQDGENPDSNTNGIGISVNSSGPSRPIYETGAVIDALVASGTPDAVALTGPPDVVGRRYQEIVQDMVDVYAWGQEDSGWARGGWRYCWNAGESDNSASQWAAIGMGAAEGTPAHISPGPDGITNTADDAVLDYWGTVPQWVKDRNLDWLNYSFNESGWFGYTSSSALQELSTGPCGMVQLAFDGRDTNDSKWITCENYLANNWSTFITADRDARYYSYYAFMKAMTTAKPKPVKYLGAAGLDWYGDLVNGIARVLVDRQTPDGYWPYDEWPYVGEQTAAGWCLIILNRNIIEALPVAVARANPNPAVVGQGVQLIGKDSYHVDPNKTIDSWEWDLDNNGVFDLSGPIVTTSFTNTGTYSITLRVTDNGVGTNELSSETIVQVKVVPPPAPPTADAGGPYLFCPQAQPWYLDGRKSSNPDEGAHEKSAPGDTIVEYLWDLNGDNIFNDATGAVVNVTSYFAGRGPGEYAVQLRVRDRTSVSFPSLGTNDLTSTASAHVFVKAGTNAECRCATLTATCLEGAVLLRWDNVGSAYYHLCRSTNSGGPYTSIATTEADKIDYLDTSVAPKTTYYYVVKPAALNTDDICQSQEASARPFYRPVARCQNLTVTNQPGTCSRAVAVENINAGSYDLDGDPITFALVPPGPYPVGITSVRLIVTDHPSTNSCQRAPLSSSNVCLVNIEVRDLDAPTISCPANITANTDPGQCGKGNLSYAATATDNCSGVTVVCAPASGSTFAKGTTTVTCIATDASGNTNRCSFIVTVRDTIAPTIVCPSNLMVTCTAPSGATVNYSVAAMDNCDTVLVPQCTPPSGSLFPIGDTTVTCTAVDAAGNSNSCRFKVMVICGDNKCPIAVIKTDHNCQLRPGQTSTIMLSSDNAIGCFTMDATMSSDPNGDTLTLHWLVDGVPIGSGTVITNCMDVGSHTVTLLADDGKCVSSTNTTVEVMTACDAVETLISAVNSANMDRRNKRPFIASLKAACASYDRGNCIAAGNQLQAFQRKVRAQVSRSNPALADDLIARAQQIIDCVDCTKAKAKGDRDDDH